MQIENNPESAMLKELRQAKDEAQHTASTGEGGNPDGQADELPEGSSTLKASEETTVDATETSEETPTPSKGDATADDTDAEEGPIRIGGQTFKTQTEAIAYAERLEREKELTDAHAAGIREALEATRQPVQPNPELEDNFEERFYANPKEALKEVQTRARDEAVAVIRRETERERMWNDFITQYPDVRRKDAERVLHENWETIGRMTNVPDAMKTLARKVRSEYEEIVALTRPRTELSSKKQIVSTGGTAPKSVTPQRKDERPLDFASQMRAAFKR
jgi:hypothetical protein